MTISELVREYRATHNISQRQFADIAGLSNGYVSMIENNINPATGMPPKLSLNTLKKGGERPGHHSYRSHGRSRRYSGKPRQCL